MGRARRQTLRSSPQLGAASGQNQHGLERLGGACQGQLESPLANKVTSWPRRTGASVGYETIRPVPAYGLGGQRSASGAIWTIFIVDDLPE